MMYWCEVLALMTLLALVTTPLVHRFLDWL